MHQKQEEYLAEIIANEGDLEGYLSGRGIRKKGNFTNYIKLILLCNVWALREVVMKKQILIKQAKKEQSEKLDNPIFFVSFLPPAYIHELHDFARRNSLAINQYSIHTQGDGHICCDKCLKAYALTLAHEIGFGGDIIAYLESLFICEAGHNGFYLDKDDLVKFNNH